MKFKLRSNFPHELHEFIVKVFDLRNFWCTYTSILYGTVDFKAVPSSCWKVVSIAMVIIR